MAGLSDRVPLLRISPIRRVTALLDEAQKKSDMISFGGGAQPSSCEGSSGRNVSTTPT